MTRSVSVLVLTLLPLTSCSSDGPLMVETERLLAPAHAAGQNPSKGSTVYAYTMSGDIASAGTAPTASKKTGDPFVNLSLSNFSVVLEQPTGDIPACRTGNGTYTDTFGDNTGQTWEGTLKIAKTTTLSFSGTNASGQSIQFSVSDATGGPVQTANGDGSHTYAYTDARLFFGSNSTHYDGLYRCVNLVLTATP